MPLTGPITQIPLPAKGSPDGTDWSCHHCGDALAVGLSRPELLPHVRVRCPSCRTLQTVARPGA